MNKKAALSQYFTPVWAAEALQEQYLKFQRGEVVCDPTCGDGPMLRAVPADVEAFGVDVDAAVAEQARVKSGRRVIVGDFRTVKLDQTPTAFFGNPPFQAEVIEGILSRCFELLPWDGRAAFILPAYALQTSSVAMAYHSRWSMDAKLLPRNLFPGLSLPLLFVQFIKARERLLVGFALYEETADVATMPDPIRETLARGAGSVWFAAVDQVLHSLGGEAHLDAIYASIEPRRPTLNGHWREKVRQTLQRRFTRTGPSRYARANHSQAEAA